MVARYICVFGSFPDAGRTLRIHNQSFYYTCASYRFVLGAYTSSSNLPPGPKGYPVVGSLFQLDLNRPWHSLAEWKKTYDDIVYLRLFNQDVIVLNSAKAAEDLLDRRAANYSDRPQMSAVEYLTGGLNIIAMNHGAG
ncbi:cytochrome p450 [Moniliophthora roreri MCA 2997]|uniref:Cytochrome p450 n=1 Tax=Moniliophthora roreri (strain MCA 2997) TaxID=1381753 RepID=V2WLT5_MONRO|nr:cytochrome p450 [Moniliophthora roreri MCA 2997]